MATTLLAGIVARFQTVVQPGYPGMTIWMGQAPENTPVPCVVIKYNAKFEWSYENSYYTEGSLTFYSFSKGLATVELIASSITAAFNQNETSIVIVNAEDFSMQQQTYLVDAEPDRTADGEQVYRAESEFQVRVSWTLPSSPP